jgi:hypothetical protein
LKQQLFEVHQNDSGRSGKPSGLFLCALSMGALLEVQALPQSGHREARIAPDCAGAIHREGDEASLLYLQRLSLHASLFFLDKTL